MLKRWPKKLRWKLDEEIARSSPYTISCLVGNIFCVTARVELGSKNGSIAFSSRVSTPRAPARSWTRPRARPSARVTGSISPMNTISRMLKDFSRRSPR